MKLKDSTVKNEVRCNKKCKGTIPLFLDEGIRTYADSGTPERCEEVLKAAKPFLDSQKKFWRERIITLFRKYTDPNYKGRFDLYDLTVDEGGLFWAFHRSMLDDMVFAAMESEPAI